MSDVVQFRPRNASVVQPLMAASDSLFFHDVLPAHVVRPVVVEQEHVSPVEDSSLRRAQADGAFCALCLLVTIGVLIGTTFGFYSLFGWIGAISWLAMQSAVGVLALRGGWIKIGDSDD